MVAFGDEDSAKRRVSCDNEVDGMVPPRDYVAIWDESRHL